jgi:hypothetical protein
MEPEELEPPEPMEDPPVPVPDEPMPVPEELPVPYDPLS